jgi:hypothetical protein
MISDNEIKSIIGEGNIGVFQKTPILAYNNEKA